MGESVFGLEEVSKPKETTESLARSAQEDITGYPGVSEGSGLSVRLFLFAD